MIQAAGSIWEHIPPEIAVAVASGVTALCVYLMRRSRTSGQAEAQLKGAVDSRDAMWERIDEMRTEVDHAKIELATLRAQVSTMPNHDHIRERIESIEDKIDRKLDRLKEELREIFEASIQKWQCPMSKG